MKENPFWTIHARAAEDAGVTITTVDRILQLH